MSLRFSALVVGAAPGEPQTGELENRKPWVDFEVSLGGWKKSITFGVHQECPQQADQVLPSHSTHWGWSLPFPPLYPIPSSKTELKASVISTGRKGQPVAGPFQSRASSREKFSDKPSVHIWGLVCRGVPYFSLTVHPPTQYFWVPRTSDLLTSDLKSEFS